MNTTRANALIEALVARGIDRELADSIVWNEIDDLVMEERRDAEADAEIRERDMRAMLEG